MTTEPPETPAPHADGPVLVWTEDGAPRSARFGDVYFSKDDGLAESRAVFLAGCDLPNAWVGRDRFVVAELGFGTGLNIVALLDLWRKTREPGARLHVFTTEAYPLSAAEAGRALSAWPEVADIVDALLAVWPRGTPGFHRIDLPELEATIDLAIGDVTWALSEWSGAADAWFLDGFSPALNPAMWSTEVFGLIAARSAPDARLATFTVAGAVRRGLAEVGFQIDKRPGHGRKRERLEGRLAGQSAAQPMPRSVAVIGAGIAGASVVRALAVQGITATMIEAEAPGAGGSGFPSALVTPRLDAGDALIAGFHAQALERAATLYRQVPGAILAQSVLQLEQAPRDGPRYARIAAQELWAEGEMSVFDAEEVAHRLVQDHIADPQAEPRGGLAMTGAMAIQPSSVLKAWLADTPRIAAHIARLEQTPNGWRGLDATGTEVFTADVVVFTAGWGNAALMPSLDLKPVRGQADWVDGVITPALAWGGYATPTNTGMLFGATHIRDDEGTEVREADSTTNLETLARRLPALAERVATLPRSARAATRATTRDRLPLCGPVAPGLYVLGGLGSRGFCVAPLLAEHLAARIAGAPSPLPRSMEQRLAADRFSPLTASPSQGDTERPKPEDAPCARS